MYTGHDRPTSAPAVGTAPRLGSVKPRSKLGAHLADLLANSPHLCMAAVTQQMERLEREMADVAEAEATAAAVNDMLGPITAERLVQEAGLERDDALMAELSDRINAVREAEAHTERAHAVQDLLYVCCVMCFAEIGLALTPNLHHDTAANAYATADPQQLDLLLHAHSKEAIPLVQQYLSRLMNQPDPMLVGAWQMRMPPMEGRVTISIPHVFLLQMYDESVHFGYSLRHAQQVQELDRVMGMASATGVGSVGSLQQQQRPDESSTSSSRTEDVNDMPTSVGGPLRTVEAAHAVVAPLSAYLPSHAPVRLQSGAAMALCGRHTAALFGAPAVLQGQMDAVLAESASAEDAQERLDTAMRGGHVAWLNISVSGLQRLILEAVLFGRILRDVERTFDVEYGLV